MYQYPEQFNEIVKTFLENTWVMIPNLPMKIEIKHIGLVCY